MNEQGVGRVFVVRCPGSLDGNGLTPEEVVQGVVKSGAKFLILDATSAAFVDTPGVRWLIRLRSLLESMGKGFRIAARTKGGIPRNLEILKVNIDCYDTVATAWRTPWKSFNTTPPAKRKRAA
jgi:hypothetical protein